jgi:TP901 family phage tail tape measure protein
MSNVKAITLATDEDMEKLTNQAMELGSKTVFTALESAEAMKFLGMAGLDTNRIMETLPATMDLAAGSATDL